MTESLDQLDIMPVEGELFSYKLTIPGFNSSAGGFHYIIAEDEGGNRTAFLEAVSQSKMPHFLSDCKLYADTE